VVQTIRQSLGTKSDDEVADWMSDISPGSNNEMTARAEFLRRQTLLQREATQAAKDAAQAAKDTAIYTKKNARYMLWSVVVLAVASVVSATLSISQRVNVPPPTTTTGLLQSPPCKNGAATCEPWDREWGKAQLQPGSVVTKGGTIIPPSQSQP